MALSNENIAKLHLNGIYTCQPQLNWIESWRRDDPYHCINWTFKVMQNDSGMYYMRDTYWSSGGLRVELTDANFDIFEFLLDLDEASKIGPPDFYDYNEEDRWHIALDSGGYQFSKYYFVRKGAQKNKEAELERLQSELRCLEHQRSTLEEKINKLKQEISKSPS